MMNEKIKIAGFSDEYATAFDEQLSGMKRLGISHIELRFVDGKSVADLDDSDIAYVKEKLSEYGIRISAIGSPLGKIRLDEDVEAHLRTAEKLFAQANALEVPFVRIFSFYAPKGERITDHKDEVFACLERMISLAEKYGITLCHENEARIYGDTPERCLELMEHFGGRLSSVFDMGNFALDGIDALAAYESLKPYIKYFHIKDSLSAGAIVPPGCGEANIREILERHAEYSALPFFVTLEPHLETFAGLHALTDRGFDNPYKFDNPQISFEVALDSLREIISRNTFKSYLLTVNIYESRRKMGEASAKDIKSAILRNLAKKEKINMIFAAAPSQNEVLASLVADKDIPWERINAFHMDEYIGLPSDAPQGFGNFLRSHIFDLVPFGSVNYIRSDATDADAECRRYSALLESNPTDIVVMGIGENGHIAFNDPPVADFLDKRLVKPVKLDEICRQQQVNDGCFASIDEVPTHAITLTVPALTRAPELYCIVPAPTKAWAVKETLTGTVDEHCPASILRRHPRATLYLDPDSSSLIGK